MARSPERPAPEAVPDPENVRPPSALDSALVFGVLIVLLAASYLLGKDSALGPKQIARIFSSVVAGVVVHKNGMR
jgi:hypothetical protein